MAIPQIIVNASRKSWRWQWEKLMQGLGPADSKGNYLRPESQYQKSIAPSKEEIINRSKDNKPILIIGRSCPWAHRTWLIYELRNLNSNLQLHLAEPCHQTGRWVLKKEILGCYSLLELYKKYSYQSFSRATVPILIDPIGSNGNKPKILGNESAQLIETLNKWPSTQEKLDLAPKELKKDINRWQDLLQQSVNNGVYKCGFARNQNAYNKASKELFHALKIVEEHLSKKGPWLCGEKLTLADIRLFPTLIRWESVYEPLFGCRLKPFWTFPNLWEWRKKLFNLRSVAKTCDNEIWRKDYFGALFPLNPSNIIPNGERLQEIMNYEIPQFSKEYNQFPVNFTNG